MTVALVLLALWLVIAAGNASRLWRRAKADEHFSLVLFAGGIFGVLGVLALPIRGAWHWAWVPAVLDVGSLPALVMMVVALIREEGSGDA